MKLFLTKDWHGQEELLSSQATETEISEIIHSLDWQTFHALRLVENDNNWIEVSGNISEDGLAIVYEEQGVSHISDQAPETIQQLEETLLSYWRRDQQFKQWGFTAYPEDPTPQEQPPTENWRDRFVAQRAIERGNRRLVFIGSIILLIIFIVISFPSITDEIKFIGHRTSNTSALVTDIKWIKLYRGYSQLVAYEFEFEGRTYQGTFRGTKFTGIHELNDQIRIKFAVDAPGKSKWVARLKKNPESNR